MGTQSNLDLVIAGLRGAVADAVKRVAFNISAELISTTPVDTGWARSNWVISIGEPISSPVGSRDAVDQSAQADGQARMLVYDVMQGAVHITNNVPYIEVLNTGHSPQAPAGFIEAAIARGLATATTGATGA